ncbi:E3 ubiquitin-protein ligase BRE1B-like [Passer montanus]|uniref:E3 ubiquitin-protein ligase BRE1B-like n=1 Tax=Passer montanus TaxID=9160 RepID=UPI001961E054|nr:E3 ubiquitin-protein ligase BRE1B-like [Passer montanus]
MAGVGAKRGPPEAGGGPPEKRPPREEQPPTTLIEPLRLGGISSTEEMDVKVLQFRNKKLAERLEQRQACEDELRERIEKLEKRQATDDATLHLVNRFWAQVRGTPGCTWAHLGQVKGKKMGLKPPKMGLWALNMSLGTPGMGLWAPCTWSAASGHR